MILFSCNTWLSGRMGFSLSDISSSVDFFVCVCSVYVRCFHVSCFSQPFQFKSVQHYIYMYICSIWIIHRKPSHAVCAGIAQKIKNTFADVPIIWHKYKSINQPPRRGWGRLSWPEIPHVGHGIGRVSPFGFWQFVIFRKRMKSNAVPMYWIWLDLLSTDRAGSFRPGHWNIP